MNSFVFLLLFFNDRAEHVRQTLEPISMEAVNISVLCDIVRDILAKTDKKLCSDFSIRMVCFWLATFSPFPTMFSKASSISVITTWDCVVKI